MTVLQTIAVAFAMFSALPMPQFEWNEKNMRYAMCAFPLIGLVCGGLWCLCGVLPLPEQLETLARELAEYDIVIATEVGGGVVPMDAEERAGREAAGRLACLLAERADCVVQMFCGIPTVLKGELPQC